MTISEASVIQAVADRSIYTIQTREQAQSDPPANTCANILYDSSSRTQSSFSDLYLEAQDTLEADLAREGKIATDAQKIRLYALLIADAHLKKTDPNWSAQAVSFYGESVTRSYATANAGIMTSYGAAYRVLISKLTAIDYSASTEPVETRDSECYPDEFRLSSACRGAGGPNRARASHCRDLV